MSFRIRPGKVTCAGLVGILMVLPNSIWQGPDAKVQPKAVLPRLNRTTKIERKVLTPEDGRRQSRPRSYTK